MIRYWDLIHKRSFWSLLTDPRADVRAKGHELIARREKPAQARRKDAA